MPTTLILWKLIALIVPLRQRKEKLRLEKLKAAREERTTTPEQREESFRRWTERKRAQAERRHAEEVTLTNLWQTFTKILLLLYDYVGSWPTESHKTSSLL